jgi:hypothetical protein
LIEENDHLQIVEIKASSTVKSDMFKEMDRFQSLDPDNPIKKTLVYGGTEAQKRSNYNVVPWNQLGVGKW